MNQLHDQQDEAVLDGVIRDLHVEPVDLLSIGDASGESAYISNSRLSYLRTLSDIVRIADCLPADRHKIRILEIGAFLGVVSRSLARLGFSVTAMDIPEFMANRNLIERYTRDGVGTMTSNLRDYRIEADAGSYDLIIMCETLEHLNFNPLPVMAEINRILSDSGRLYLSLPNQASLVNRVKLVLGRSIHNPIIDFVAQLSRESNMIVGIHWREYTAVELEDLVIWGGFEILRHYFFTTHQASIPARILYLLFPRLRGNQTIVARKVAPATPVFFCHEVTR